MTHAEALPVLVTAFRALTAEQRERFHRRVRAGRRILCGKNAWAFYGPRGAG